MPGLSFYLLCLLRHPPKDQLIRTRLKGNYFLEITGHPGFGLSLGQPDPDMSIDARHPTEEPGR